MSRLADYIRLSPDDDGRIAAVSRFAPGANGDPVVACYWRYPNDPAWTLDLFAENKLSKAAERRKT